jgi:hypothetical protein
VSSCPHNPLADAPHPAILTISCCHNRLLQIASYLNRLTSDLEAAAYPALDSLTSRVTSHNLERVRRIKSRLVRLTTRVENVSVWDWGWRWGPCRNSDGGRGMPGGLCSGLVGWAEGLCDTPVDCGAIVSLNCSG